MSQSRRTLPVNQSGSTEAERRIAHEQALASSRLAGHVPTRVREKVMRRFKSTRQLQRFCSTHDQINNLFQHCRYHLDAQAKRNNREVAFARWHQMTGLATSPTAAL